MKPFSAVWAAAIIIWAGTTFAQTTSALRDAPEKGMAEVKFNLRNTYRDGKEVPQDYAEAG
jgi:hypothetical protein